MSGSEHPAPSGWYTDPADPHQQRWWDGGRWTIASRPLHDAGRPVSPPPLGSGHQRNGVAPQPVLASPPPDRSRPSWWIAGVVGVALVAVLATLNTATTDDGRRPDTLASRAVPALDADQVPGANPQATGDDGAGPAVDDEPEPTPESTDDAEAEPAEPIEPIDPVEPAEPAEPAEPTDPPPAIGMGTRQDPLPYATPVDLTWTTFGDAENSRWTTTIGPPVDLTNVVLAGSEFNSPPPDGVRYAGFEVELTLVDAAKEPLAPAFNFSWEIVGGATALAYDQTTLDAESFGCGELPGEFDSFAEAFVGGTLSGTVCIPIPEADLADPGTRVALHFSDDTRAIFGPG